MTPRDLVAAARRVMATSHTSTAAGAREAGMHGLWPRAVALLARQSLERGLDDLWAAVAPRVLGSSRKAQLLSLGQFVRDRELVDGVRHAWHGLSRACHHHSYELPPTAAELERWLEAAERLAAHDPVRP